MKAQASLIQDDDPSEKDEDMQNKQLQYQPSLSKSFKVLQHQLSFASECSDAEDSDDNTPASVSPVGSTTNLDKCERSDDDVSVITTLGQPTTNISLGNDNHADNNLPEKYELEIYKKSTDGVHTNSGYDILPPLGVQLQKLALRTIIFLKELKPCVGMEAFRWKNLWKSLLQLALWIFWACLI